MDILKVGLMDVKWGRGRVDMSERSLVQLSVMRSVDSKADLKDDSWE
jgi:hypothetical protein